MPTLAPSPYQEAIYDWVVNGSGDAFVEAVAGSGKTTTLIGAARLVRTANAAFYAFNKSIVVELEERLKGTTFKAKTINGLGHGALMKKLGRNIRLDANKYRDLARNVTDHKVLPREWDAAKYAKMLMDVTSFVMSSLTNPADPIALAELCDAMGIEVPEDGDWMGEVCGILKQGEQLAEQGLISFDDQIFLPVKWNLAPAKADFIFVDEAQDLSRAKLELILMSRSRGGRILFVGDPKQAIYGFAGADANSVRNIIARTNATIFPLSVCYRCPSAVIELAKAIVPQLEARPGAPEGKVERIEEAQLDQMVREGDLILCRLTAPLIRECLSLIAKRKPARVKGREIGAQLAKMIRDVAKRYRVRDLNDFPKALDEYANWQIAKLSAKKNSEKQVEALQDKIDGILVCYESSHATTVEGLCSDIESLFSDDRASIELSTIHKAKGLEENRVFILHPDKLPLTWKGQQDWEFEQEMNLKYVALTRAKEELYFVNMKERQR